MFPELACRKLYGCETIVGLTKFIPEPKYEALRSVCHSNCLKKSIKI